MNDRPARIVLLIVLALGVASCGGGSEVEDAAARYLQAWRTHDATVLTEMTSPQVVLDFGRGTLVGRAPIINGIEFSAGANTVVETANVVIHGDTVDFELREKNDIVTACGLDALIQYPRLVFENGIVVRKAEFRQSRSLRVYAEQLSILRSWIRRSRPDILAEITDDHGQYKINRRTGELLALMAKTWQESKTVE